MAVVINNYLTNLAAQMILGQTGPPGAWQVNLFINFRAPQPTDGLAIYQLCSLPGYSPMILAPDLWQGGIVPTNLAEYNYPVITWVFDAYSGTQQTIFGYVISIAGTNNVMYAELFPAPYPVPPSGGELPLTLTWLDEQCPTVP